MGHTKKTSPAIRACFLQMYEIPWDGGSGEGFHVWLKNPICFLINHFYNAKWIPMLWLPLNGFVVR